MARRHKMAAALALLAGALAGAAYLAEELWGNSETGGLVQKCWQAIEPGT